MLASYEEIKSSIYIRKKDIFKNLNNELKNGIGKSPIDIYCQLKKRLFNVDVSIDEPFQKSFKSFYSMHYPGKEYFCIFFECMQEQKKILHPNFLEVSKKLYAKSEGLKFRNGKLQNSKHQFSFITKMINLIDDKYPIYDTNIGRVFRYRADKENEIFEKKVLEQNRLMEHILRVYNIIDVENLIGSVISDFDNIFSNCEVPFTKKIDFMLWKLGD